MNSYQSPEDLVYARQRIKEVNTEASAFLALKAAAERKDGIIPEKYRDLMSIAVALTTQCSYRIDAHVQNAMKAGAAKQELAETVFIASGLRAGAAVGQGLMAMHLFEEREAQGHPALSQLGDA